MTSVETISKLSTLVMFIVALSILGITDLLTKSHKIWMAFLILIILQSLSEKYLKRFMQKCLMDKGICINNCLIEWDRVRSYKWVIPRKKTDFVSMEINYSKYYTKHLISMTVLDEQKEEVDELVKKMTRV